MGAAQLNQTGKFGKASYEPFGRRRTADTAGGGHLPRAYSAHTSVAHTEAPSALKASAMQGVPGHEDTGVVGHGTDMSGSGPEPRLTVQQEARLVFKQAWEVRGCASRPALTYPFCDLLLAGCPASVLRLTLECCPQVFMAFLASVTVLYAGMSASCYSSDMLCSLVGHGCSHEAAVAGCSVPLLHICPLIRVAGA
jgi:hypothetical protein